MDEVGHLGSAAFFLLFLFAGLSKVDSWQAWRSAVAEFVPNARVSRLAAASVPGLEFTCAALLVAQQALGLLATGATLAAFACAVIVLRRNHAGAPCRCMGAIANTRIGGALAARNLGLAVAAGALSASASSRPMSVPVIAFACVAGACGLVSVETRRFVVSSAHMGVEP